VVNVEYEGKWKPSWDKGAFDTDVIDLLVIAREALQDINGIPNYEQRKKILIECKNIMELVE